MWARFLIIYFLTTGVYASSATIEGRAKYCLAIIRTINEVGKKLTNSEDLTKAEFGPERFQHIMRTIGELEDYQRGLRAFSLHKLRIFNSFELQKELISVWNKTYSNFAPLQETHDRLLELLEVPLTKDLNQDSPELDPLRFHSFLSPLLASDLKTADAKLSRINFKNFPSYQSLGLTDFLDSSFNDLKIDLPLNEVLPHSARLGGASVLIARAAYRTKDSIFPEAHRMIDESFNSTARHYQIGKVLRLLNLIEAVFPLSTVEFIPESVFLVGSPDGRTSRRATLHLLRIHRSYMKQALLGRNVKYPFEEHLDALKIALSNVTSSFPSKVLKDPNSSEFVAKAFLELAIKIVESKWKVKIPSSSYPDGELLGRSKNLTPKYQFYFQTQEGLSMDIDLFQAMNKGLPKIDAY
ncbi:MAG: hypothetical protein JWQ35_1538 [Bacteriovoracaceae bacterium]|nr:hypothetical protein [Bacteriovoracaceae bacterium]